MYPNITSKEKNKHTNKQNSFSPGLVFFLSLIFWCLGKRVNVFFPCRSCGRADLFTSKQTSACYKCLTNQLDIYPCSICLAWGPFCSWRLLLLMYVKKVENWTRLSLDRESNRIKVCLSFLGHCRDTDSSPHVGGLRSKWSLKSHY